MPNPIIQGINDWVYSKKEYRELALSSKDWDSLMRLRDILEVRADNRSCCSLTDAF